MNKELEINFITEIKAKVRRAQYEALKVVNVHLINLYWEIGKSISEKQSESWGKAIVLIHQIENKTYAKYLLNQTNFEQTLPSSIKNQAYLAVKDEYTFDFLNLSEEHSESQLENAHNKPKRNAHQNKGLR